MEIVSLSEALCISDRTGEGGEESVKKLWFWILAIDESVI
jgi:hypothetical protein